ncbi:MULTISPECIES: hypothetical protein [unclassified Parafrankia]|uniref:hypothetical protein n=1 Tax=unclassified Parafrankia TaxID=2994368 RepID=UPI000DA458D5|nr:MULTISPECIES: hypothetical protein [unclassified Parafrankia]TCJ32015.1 hypothetical protein E0504_45475 [Parafrankia sp. BMG5.11]SQD96885.1 conserved membrane hypothetical protein [Parafrankia sp. Ea1.12]
MTDIASEPRTEADHDSATVAAAADFPVPRPLLTMTGIEFVVLFFTGTGLAFQYKLTARLWPWDDLTLFNSRFLGAIYLTSLVAVACLLATRRWSPARVVAPMIGVFTLCVIVVSTAYPSRFAFSDRPLPVIGWFVLYVALPVCAFWYTWRLRGRARAAGVATPVAWRYWLRLFAVLMTGQAVGLLAAPEQVTEFWPWTVDAFHGQLYAATFLAGGVGAWLVSVRATRAELRTVGLTQASFGLFAIGGAALVELDTGVVEWSDPGTTAWLAMMLFCAASGFAVIARSLQTAGDSERELKQGH